ncbi:MAG: YraN family protein [Phycisphaeraceae bacterium]|nr:YraN family protein [Phycisphaeraceae bacterium]
MRRFFQWLGSTRRLGPRAERAAAAYLRQQGYRLLGRNLRNRFGEIDLLAEDPADRTLAVVEVKAATSEQPGPEVHLNEAKRRKLSGLAAQLVRDYRLGDRRVRFDLIAVVWPTDRRRPVRLDHHRNAFGSVF